MICEEGNRSDFKRCVTENVETLTYPCGHVYIPVYEGGAVQEAIPLACQRCCQHTVFFTNPAWAKMALAGVTYTEDMITVDMQMTPPQTVERIDIQFTVNDGGIVWQHDN